MTRVTWCANYQPKSREAIFQAIREYIRETGASPGVRDIIERSGMSSGSVTHQLNMLERSGQITRFNFIARSIELADGRSLLVDIANSFMTQRGLSAGDINELASILISMARKTK